MLIGLTFFSLLCVFFTVFVSALYSYKSKKDNFLFKVINRISYFLPNLNSCTRDPERNDTVTHFTLTESDVDSYTDKEPVITTEYRTASYNTVMGRNSEKDNNLTHRSISSATVERNEIIDNHNKVDSSSNASNASNSSSVTTTSEESKESSDSNATTASERKIKVYARKLESVFTIIFLFSFIVYTIVMFAFIPI